MLLDLRHPVRLARELRLRKHMLEKMGVAYMSQGFISEAGSRTYTSMADTDEVIDEAFNKFETALGAGAYRDRWQQITNYTAIVGLSSQFSCSST
jgi:hypothetical protein